MVLLENRMLKIFNERANQYSSPQNQLKDQLHVKKAGGITYTCCNLRPVLMFLFVVGTRSTYSEVPNRQADRNKRAGLEKNLRRRVLHSVDAPSSWVLLCQKT